MNLMDSHCTLPTEKTNAFSSFRISFLIAACVMLILMVVLSLDYGISWDEWIQNHYGRLILKYIMSGGQEKDCLTFFETEHFYGGLFDTLSGALYVPLFFLGKFELYTRYPPTLDIVLPHLFDTRHALNALFGFMAILWTGLLAKKAAGWRAGFFSLLLLFFSPRFFGNCMNNPKDIPFAAAYIFSIYHLVCFVHELPRPRVKTAFCLALGIALAINIKIGGVLLLCYLYLFTAIYAGRAFLRQEKIHWLYLAGLVLLTSVAGYWGGMLFWPYGLEDPFRNPIRALHAMSQFSGAKGLLLFEGRQIPFDQTPWYYLPKWILISTPFSVLTGLLLFFVMIIAALKHFPAKTVVMIAFAAIFPLFYIIYQKSIIYDSWRHVFFVYPPLVILAALGWECLFRSFKTKSKKIAAGGFLCLQLFFPLAWMVRNHPNEYVYFNGLTGGLRGAFGRYETDYWGNSLRAAAEWLAKDYQKSGAKERIVIGSDGEFISSAYYLSKILGSKFATYEKGKNQWEYYLSLSRGISPEKLRAGEWPPPGTIHTIEADRTPLCAIVKRTAGQPTGPS